MRKVILNIINKPMPFKSKSQQRYMFSQHPTIAKRWAKHTPNIKSLPQKAKKKK